MSTDFHRPGMGLGTEKTFPQKRRLFQCHKWKNPFYQSVLYSQGDLICACTRARDAL
jgi:hypothetical protein